MGFLQIFIKSLRDKVIRKRLLFTFLVLMVFRLGTYLTMPGVDLSVLPSITSIPLMEQMSLLTGSGLQTFSIFALGIGPYITASIVMQLLQLLVPKLEAWSKQGEMGRQKLNGITRYMAIVFACLQSIGITVGFNSLSGGRFYINPQLSDFVFVAVLLTTGSMIVMWMAEQITEKGIGNGSSMIILTGVIASVPNLVYRWAQFLQGLKWTYLVTGYVALGLIGLICFIGFVLWFQQAEYHVPLHTSRQAERGPVASYMPIKLNPSGVLPIIFATSLLSMPMMISQLYATTSSSWQKWSVWLNYGQWQGMVVYCVLIKRLVP